MQSAVSSYNEWDPLEEVIVGRLEGAAFPPRHDYIKSGVPREFYSLLFWLQGHRIPGPFAATPAQRELDEFIHILEAEGVRVRRPDIVDHQKKFSTPRWKAHGFVTACPRDCFLVVGTEIIEAPMAWRYRYFERHAYYNLFKEYFAAGCKWTSAPKPPLYDNLYSKDYSVPKGNDPVSYYINESEIVFDAADFIRCGKDIFVTRSNVTNAAGIEWVRRHLGDTYSIHEIISHAKQPMHIDSTFIPLGPGRVMINPEYVDPQELPAVTKSWEVLIAPKPVITERGFFGEKAAQCSLWVNMNVLMLDSKRVICEKTQEPMVRALKEWGFETIPVKFTSYNPFGGAFHCATLDIRRRGRLECYR